MDLSHTRGGIVMYLWLKAFLLCWCIIAHREDFTAYADVCFRTFGDRVQYWITINEVNMFAFGSYDTGFSPPSRCSFPFGYQCIKGDSTTEPYIVAHNLLLAHASVAKLYKENYQVWVHKA